MVAPSTPRSRERAERVGSVPSNSSSPTDMANRTKVDTSLMKDTLTVRVVVRARARRLKHSPAPLTVTSRTGNHTDRSTAETSPVNRAATNHVNPNGVSHTKAAHSARHRRLASLSRAIAPRSVSRRAQMSTRPPPIRSRPNRTWSGRRHRHPPGATSNSHRGDALTPVRHPGSARAEFLDIRTLVGRARIAARYAARDCWRRCCMRP